MHGGKFRNFVLKEITFFGSSLSFVLQILHEAWTPIAAISKLNSSPILGLMTVSIHHMYYCQ